MLLLAIACIGSTSTPPGHDLGWVEALVRDPTRFPTVVTPESREGWIAFHQNDWFLAYHSEGAPKSRAAAELERLYGVLAQTSHHTWSIIGKLRQNDPLLNDSLLLLFFRFSAQAAGDSVATNSWQDRALGASPRVSAFARRWERTIPPEVPKEADELSVRMEEHRSLRAGTGDLARFRSIVTEPVIVEPVPARDPSLPSSTRAIYDPLVFDSLQVAMRSSKKPIDDNLSSVLFSGSLSGKSAKDTLLTMELQYPAQPDGNSCRELARALDQRLDAKGAELTTLAVGDGAALLDDLQLVAGFRSRLLVDLAVESLPTAPACALALASLALEERSRGIGPLNSPTLFAVLAYANLATGHHREAKDAIQKLVPAFPEVLGLDETIGDLVVLGSMGRDGTNGEQ